MRKLFALPIALGLVALAGCSSVGTVGTSSILVDAAHNLATIHSGTIKFELRGAAGAGSSPVGFKIEGPFSFGQDGLPIARLHYVEFGTARPIDATFVSDGSHAFVEANGTTHELSGAAAQRLRGVAGNGPLGVLHLDRWLVSPSESDGGTIDGVATRRITAGIDMAAVVGDLAAIAAASGAQTTPLTEAESKAVDNSVTSSSFELFAGAQDRLVRRLRMSVALGAAGSPALRRALGRFGEAHLSIALDLSKPNRRVEVRAP